MKIGLIRGGQLGLMLIETGMRYSDQFFILDSDPQAPCRDFCSDFKVGNPLDADEVEAFGKGMDAIILEFENVSVEGLRRLEKRGVKVFPSADVLECIQDKGLQKNFFKEKNLPTSSFALINHREDLKSYQSQLPFILKLRKGGYDGKGVMLVNKLEDIPESWNNDFILEEKVNILKELAVVVARDQDGHMSVFPTVEMVFHEQQNMLDFLIAPARISPEQLKKSEALAKQTAEAFGIVGILAVEMFLTDQGDLLINEVAPRVHNSGHCTIKSSHSSQFDQMMRIVHGFPLGNTELLSPVAMINLVGHPDYRGPVKYEGLNEVLALPKAHLNLYGKKETTPYRKMGHVVFLDATIEKVIEGAKMIKNTLIVRA